MGHKCCKCKCYNLSSTSLFIKRSRKIPYCCMFKTAFRILTRVLLLLLNHWCYLILQVSVKSADSADFLVWIHMKSAGNSTESAGNPRISMKSIFLSQISRGKHQNTKDHLPQKVYIPLYFYLPYEKKPLFVWKFSATTKATLYTLKCT